MWEERDEHHVFFEGMVAEHDMTLGLFLEVHRKMAFCFTQSFGDRSVLVAWNYLKSWRNIAHFRCHIQHIGNGYSMCTAGSKDLRDASIKPLPRCKNKREREREREAIKYLFSLTGRSSVRATCCPFVQFPAIP